MVPPVGLLPVSVAILLREPPLSALASSACLGDDVVPYVRMSEDWVAMFLWTLDDTGSARRAVDSEAGALASLEVNRCIVGGSVKYRKFDVILMR